VIGRGPWWWTPQGVRGTGESLADDDARGIGIHDWSSIQPTAARHENSWLLVLGRFSIDAAAF
jgi:hypothetical protein